MSRRGLLTEEELQIVRNKLTDEEAIAKFERHCHLKNLRPSTIEFYKNEFKAVKSSFYPSKKVQAILENYIRLRGDLSHACLFINRDNKPLKPRSIQTRFEKYKEEVGIEKQFSPHILRHTYAKRSILAGMDTFSLAALLGHSDLSVTKKYVALWGNDLEGWKGILLSEK